MACQAKGREVRIIHYHVGQYRLVLVVIVAGFLYTWCQQMPKFLDKPGQKPFRSP